MLFGQKRAEGLHWGVILVGCAVSVKGKSSGVPFHGVTSQYSLFKKFEFLSPFSKAAKKTQSCFAKHD